MAKRKKKGPSRRRTSFFGSTPFLVTAGAALMIVIAAGCFLAFRGGGGSRHRLRQAPVVVSAMTASVDVVDLDYEPRNLTVPVGATVTWRFRGDLPHNVTDDRGAFDSPTQDDGEWSRTFDRAATYYYYCTLHHGMQGTLIVGDGAVSAKETPTTAP